MITNIDKESSEERLQLGTITVSDELQQQLEGQMNINDTEYDEALDQLFMQTKSDGEMGKQSFLER